MKIYQLEKFSLLVVLVGLLTACNVSIRTANSLQTRGGKSEQFITTSSAAPTPPLAEIIVTREQVNIHGGEWDYAIQGDTYSGYCDGTWCYIGQGRRIWQGCTNWASQADYEVCQ